MNPFKVLFWAATTVSVALWAASVGMAIKILTMSDSD